MTDLNNSLLKAITLPRRTLTGYGGLFGLLQGAASALITSRQIMESLRASYVLRKEQFDDGQEFFEKEFVPSVKAGTLLP